MPRRPERGLITLEWLLIVAAIAGIAGTSVLIVQRVVDDATDVPPDPVTRMIDADIAAAHISAQAQTAFDASPEGGTPGGDPYVDGNFESLCTALSPDPQSRFGDVVVSADSGDRDQDGVDGVLGTSDDLKPPQWRAPDDPDGTPGSGDEVRARCVLTPRPNLGG